MKREIVKIDESKCNGCGVCIPNCHEGALQIIDNKAVLVSELMCDGLGACLNHCPEGALTIETRDAESYDEVKVMKEMIGKGKNVVIAHLKHLKDHNETAFLKQGVRFLWDNKDILEFNPAEVVEEVHGLMPMGKPYVIAENLQKKVSPVSHACPGSASMHIERETMKNMEPNKGDSGDQASSLTHWPIQLHLINPSAGYFAGSDLLLAADCVAFSLGNFHTKYLKNKKLIIACPKLDQGKEIYVEKLKRLMDEARVNTITVMRMEVPCCGGLMQMVKAASQFASAKVPVKEVVVSISGEVIMEGWV